MKEGASGAGLADLVVDDVRCLGRAELALGPRQNLIWGSNGSGKTSLLEAIFLLGRGRSFRTRNSERLIRHGESRLTVFGRAGGERLTAIGVQVTKGAGTTARIDGHPAASLTELSLAFPVQVIDPSVHKLVEEGGFRRRRWMDWAVFHVEPHFADAWARYTRAIKQRNAALRRQSAQAIHWDPELIRLGELIADARLRMLERLQPFWHQAMQRLTGLELELHYSRGWNPEVSLTQALADSRARDQAKGLTHPGPHRADVLIRLGSRSAREVLSRGQQKLAAIGMTLAQIQLLQQEATISPTLLLDDPAAELDGTHLQRFIDWVGELRCQLVITSLHPHFDEFGKAERVFHVEQGRVASV
jgi:DNA replication and repair protein RecF